MRQDEIVTVTPHTTIEELERVLTENEISGVPVLNDRGELIGVVSQSDIVRFIHQELDGSSNFYRTSGRPPRSAEKTLDEQLRSKEVWEIMETRLHTVSPDRDVPTIAKILRKHHIHRVLVVEDKKLVGIVTTFDLLLPLENPELVSAISTSAHWKHWTPLKHCREEQKAP